MGFIKNFNDLATSPERKIVLELVEAALASIQPERVISKNITVAGRQLTVVNQTFDLSQFESIYLIGFGKGSAAYSSLIEEKLGDNLRGGYVIDTNPVRFSKLECTQGTHPLPSQTNYEFTKNLIYNFEGKLSDKDLVLAVICGGGSAMLVAPNTNITLDEKIAINRALLESGATISQMNMVRKHLSRVKGGGLAKILHPARVASLIFSDVPGNDVSVIASGPTVKDPTTVSDAWNVISEFKLTEKVDIKREDLAETPKEDTYFAHVSNIIVLSNQTALSAMQQKAKEAGYSTAIFSDKFQGDAKIAGKTLIDATSPHSLLLFGGETTVKVAQEHGEGGRNQEVVLAALPSLDETTVICSFDSDGWDNSPFAGAIGDIHTRARAQDLKITPEMYLNKDDALKFFEAVGDGIVTGRLPSNISDLMIVLKK